MRILVILGTRPEAIKMAPVVHTLHARPDQCDTHVCATGQHRQMLDQVLDLFGISPDFDLDLMQDGQTPSQVAARVLLALDPLLEDLRPDWALVQGDTTTVMAATIAAHHRHIRVAHVEAGLRTYDRANPFPEEMNRIVADHVSDLRFAPTRNARDNLLREGIPPASVHVTGNTVIDALLWMADRPLDNPMRARFDQLGLRWLSEPPVPRPAAPDGRLLILVTLHRRENHGRPLRDVCRALRRLTTGRPHVQIVYPVHRNPNVWGPVHQLLADVPQITLLPPVDYLTLVHLMKHSHLILTDSGGIQEEAPSLGVPVLVLREATERPEAVEAGVARVVGTDTDRVVAEAVRLLDDPAAHGEMARATSPYGDGRAAERIADVLLHGKCDEFLPGGCS